MSAANVTVRYDGPILANHRMDVADLAPALLGISELCKIANRKFNGERAAVKVLIGADVEHKCFQLNLHVVQTLWDHAKTFLALEDVKSAKEVLEWIGLITGTSVLGLFGLLKALKHGTISGTHLETVEGRDVVQVSIKGDNNTIVVAAHPQALAMLKDSSAVANAKKVVEPLTHEGYESVEFETSNATERIEKIDAVEILRVSSEDLDSGPKDEPQTITAWVTVYSPVYDLKAPRWRFKFGDIHAYMDIRDTEIAPMAMLRGGAMIDDAYRVELEITQEHKASSIANHYKIKKVLEFKPATLPHQHDAFADFGK